MATVEDIKREIINLIQDAANQGVKIRSIEAEFIQTIGDRPVVLNIDIEESRTK